MVMCAVLMVAFEPGYFPLLQFFFYGTCVCTVAMAILVAYEERKTEEDFVRRRGLTYDGDWCPFSIPISHAGKEELIVALAKKANDANSRYRGVNDAIQELERENNRLRLQVRTLVNKEFDDPFRAGASQL